MMKNRKQYTYAEILHLIIDRETQAWRMSTLLKGTESEDLYASEAIALESLKEKIIAGKEAA
jgi:hypothetical protein